MTSLPSKRGPYRTSSVRRRRILEAATVVFAHHGYVGGSLRRIAAEAGITEPGLLHQFGTKETLLKAVLDYWSEELDWLSASTSERGVDGLQMIGRRLATHRERAEPRRMLSIISAEASTDAHPARQFVTERHHHQLRRIATLILDASSRGELATISAGEAEGEARLMTGLVDGLELQWLMEPATDVAGLVADYVRALVERLRESVPPT